VPHDPSGARCADFFSLSQCVRDNDDDWKLLWGSIQRNTARWRVRRQEGLHRVALSLQPIKISTWGIVVVHLAVDDFFGQFALALSCFLGVFEL